jgi:hypothetical protein
LRNARFLADGRRIITTDEHGQSRLWELRTDDHPLDDLILMAGLLSGNSVTPAGQLSPVKSGSLETVWKQLRDKHPSDFVTSAEEIAAWHEFHAEESEVQEQWAAAVFHLQRLLVIRPDDQFFADRLARARKMLAKNDAL